MERKSLERGSSERGASLLEILFVITAAMVFALAIFAYFSQTSTQWSVIETQDDLSRAIRDVQESYPAHIFNKVPSANLSEAVRDKTAPLGEINAFHHPGDPADSFRITLTDLPSADQEGLCASLLERMLKAPHTDAGRCRARAGASQMELRVRKEQNPLIVALIDLPLQYVGIPNCENACNPANWRGPMPTREEMLVIRATLEIISALYSASDSCESETWNKYSQCLSSTSPFYMGSHGGYSLIYSPDGTSSRINSRGSNIPPHIEEAIRQGLMDRPLAHDPDNPAFYPTTLEFEIEESVHEILKKYDSRRNNGNLREGYKGMRLVRCDMNGCLAGAFATPPQHVQHLIKTWWLEE